MFNGVTTITFDLDDTLWAIGPVIQRAEQESYNYLCKHFSKITDTHTVETLRQMRVKVGEDMPQIAYDFTQLRKIAFERLLDTAGYPLHHADDLLEHFMQERHKVTFFPDALPALETLSRRFKLVSLSNGNAELDRLSLDKLFIAAVSARKAGVAKPHKAIFELACKEANADAGETLHVGDHPTEDVLAAQTHGMRAVWVNRTGAVWKQSQQPDASITNLAELVRLLDA